MTPYTEKRLAAIANYESKCGVDPSDSILEALRYDYSCQNPVEDGKIRAAEVQLRPVFEERSVASSDRLSDLIVEST